MTFFPLLVILILFSFLFFFVCEKTQFDCLFLKDMITHETSSYLFTSLFGDSFRVYVLFDLVTLQFWSDVMESFDV